MQSITNDKCPKMQRTVATNGPQCSPCVTNPIQDHEILDDAKISKILCCSSTPSFTNCICCMITYTIPRAFVGKAFRNTASPNFSGGQCRFNSSCGVEAKALWEPMGRIDFGTWMGKTQIFFGKATGFQDSNARQHSAESQNARESPQHDNLDSHCFQ